MQTESVLLDLYRQPRSSSSRQGLFWALSTTLLIIWLPIPDLGGDPPPRLPGKPLVIPTIHQMKLETEKPSEVTLNPIKELRPVPWQVEQVPTDISFEPSLPIDDQGYDPTQWEIDEPEQKPDPIYLPNQEGLNPPIYIEKTAPDYPVKAVRVGIQGYVILGATLTREGKIEDIEVLKNLGDYRFGFEDEAKRALASWKFLPGSLNGQPVSVRLVLKIDFHLS